MLKFVNCPYIFLFRLELLRKDSQFLNSVLRDPKIRVVPLDVSSIVKNRKSGKATVKKTDSIKMSSDDNDNDISICDNNVDDNDKVISKVPLSSFSVSNRHHGTILGTFNNYPYNALMTIEGLDTYESTYGLPIAKDFENQ